VPVLAEAVADRTARGDSSGAADARHALAIAYLNSSRPFDAAEVAEEELAYRLRTEPATNEPSPAVPVRRLLAAIYMELSQPEEAMVQIDAVAVDCLRIGNHAGAGQMNEEAGDILDRLDRDGEAAARYLVAADQFGAAELAYEELRNRRQHAVSVTWAYGPDRGLAALAAAASLLDRLPGRADSTEVRWERAKQEFDEARIRWRAQQHGAAAELAAGAADAWFAIGEIRGASEARAMRARLLLEDGRPAEAADSIRLALAQSPEPARKESFVAVLDAALRAQDRIAEADACWAEHGLSRPA
jgi:hypothetical protein